MLVRFRGGVHPCGNKSATSGRAIETLPAPEKLVIPMSMHIGAPCGPTVKVGETVNMGQVIGDSEAAISAPIHAPVSGKVLAIEPTLHSNGNRINAVILENDGEDRLCEDIRPRGSVQSLTSDELLKIVRDAGIVGLGGATFPTSAKILSGRGKVDTLIINGAECEPYITADHRLMLEYPEEIIGGVRILMKLFDLVEASIAVESNKFDAITALRGALPKKGSEISVIPVRTIYPQGAEKQIIRTVTGREVPPGALPAEVGCAVFNVDTAAAIHRAVTTGVPLIRRIVTVSGSAVSNPKNLSVRIGTPFSALVEATGGFREEPSKVIAGGPMMGTAQFSLDVPVVKGTNALLAFSRREDVQLNNPTCIRCGRCASVCPMKLLPLYIHMYEQKDMLEDCERQRVMDCMECGSCSYICPGRLHLVQSLRSAKQKIDMKKRNAGVK